MLKRITALALLAISAPAMAEASKSLTTGFDYSTGKYGGTTSTSMLYIPVTGKVQFDYLYLKLTVPYLSVTSMGEVVVRGMGRVPAAGKQASGSTSTTAVKATTQSGLGDVVAAAGYTVYETEALALDIAGKIKFGTADANKGLGSGENDYSAQLDGFYTLQNTSLFATAGYKIVGAPAGVSVNNVAYGTLGFSQKTGNKTSAGMMLDVAQASNPQSDGTREITVFVSNKISSTLKLQASLLKGFSDSSPDYGGGLMLTGAL